MLSFVRAFFGVTLASLVATAANASSYPAGYSAGASYSDETHGQSCSFGNSSLGLYQSAAANTAILAISGGGNPTTYNYPANPQGGQVSVSYFGNAVLVFKTSASGTVAFDDAKVLGGSGSVPKVFFADYSAKTSATTVTVAMKLIWSTSTGPACSVPVAATFHVTQ
jgi:hypothetical protein